MGSNISKGQKDIDTGPGFWTNVAGAVSYDVHLGPDTNPPLVVTVTATSYVVRDLQECSQQYWRVVATNADGQIVSSPVWSFKTTCPQ